MYCPVCGYSETKVIDSRLVHDGARVRRRRECLNPDCGERFTTYEEAEVSLPLVVKQDGTREQYDSEKLRRGLLRAVEKRSVSIDTVNNLIDTIEQRMRHYSEREIPSKRIGQWVMDGLKAIDHVAYIRFASVYLSFADVAAFQKTIDELSND
ncbi:transcriptional regulator NrdR [Suttonella sp. R2A3]|uniref:transcriptional regulator NrdR n=1 Tax=Suttonella sp. R2A3 TaxID=2908648 RepID=UPI001F25A35D|nr:transcriptional regulator NrdR [Suttonella sp. R2A3]UJF25377.1 transcriptional regulator NrdR [Suttonella sp. R2A3]